MISRSKTVVGAGEVEELTRKGLGYYAWMFDRVVFPFRVSGG